MACFQHERRKKVGGWFLPCFQVFEVVILHRQLTRTTLFEVGYTSPLLTRGNDMLTVQMYKVHNHLTDEDIVMPRIVNQQVLDFNALCEYLADGSTVTAADVAAVMKQIETRLPLVLGLNAKVVCSPEGLTFRPKVIWMYHPEPAEGEAGGETRSRPDTGHRREPRPDGIRPRHQRPDGQHRDLDSEDVA